MNPNVSDPQQRGQGRVNFKCSDVGPKNCDWQVSGNSEQEIMPKIEQHGRKSTALKWTTRHVTRYATRSINNPPRLPVLQAISSTPNHKKEKPQHWLPPQFVKGVRQTENSVAVRHNRDFVSLHMVCSPFRSLRIEEKSL